MRLIIIGSNSSGNAYLLQSATDTMLIDCGVHINKIKMALGWDLRRVAAIVTHSHGDHASSLIYVLNAGINVYASKETFEVRGLEKHHRANQIVAGVNYTIGNFKVRPFNVNHDVPCFGFLIWHYECGLTLFLTDTYYCDYVFPGLNNIVVEANHDMKIVDNNNTPQFLRDRIIQSHMNLDTCKELLLANDLSKVNNIVLIHLSDKNSDAIRFKDEIAMITGKTVWIAEAGMTIDNFNENPF